MSKKFTIWVFIGLVLIILAYTLFIQKKKVPENINTQAAAVLSEAEKATLLAQLNAQVAVYQKNIDALKAQLADVKNSPLTLPPTSISISPSAVSFNGTVGGAKPSPVSVKVSTTNGSAWTSQDSCAFFDAWPITGASGISHTLTASSGWDSLPAGTASCDITYSSAGNSNLVVHVTATKQAGVIIPPVDTGTTTDNDHEPSDMTKVLVERAFDAVTEGAWNYTQFGNGSTMSIVKDPTAPRGGTTNVARVNYPVGFPGGQGVGEANFYNLGKQQKYYISTWIKFSQDWVGNPTGANKMLYIFRDVPSNPDADTIMFISEAVGAGSDKLTHTLYPMSLGANYPWYPNQFGFKQTVLDNNPVLQPNLANPEVTRGVWHHFEYVIDVGTPGKPDGLLDGWMDGKQTHHFADLTWSPTGVPIDITVLQWEPIWGGGAGTIAKEQYQYMDHIYVSGKPVASTTCTKTSPNEPCSMNLITNRAFSALKESPWLDGGTFSIVSPGSTSLNGSLDGKVGSFFYKNGFTSSDTPGDSYVFGQNYFGPGYKTLYQRMRIKYDQNWLGHFSTGANKLVYTKYGAANGNGVGGFVFEALGGGTDPLYGSVYAQGLGAPYPVYPSGVGGSPPGYASVNTVLMANLANPAITRGVWHDIEMLSYTGTPGSPDGTMEVWIDGVKTHDFKGIMWRAAGEGANYQSSGLTPLWGGTNSTLTQDQYLYVDNYYMSGK